MRLPSRWTLSSTVLALMVGISPTFAQGVSSPLTAQPGAGRIHPSPVALQQIQAILADKASLTPAQKRIDSNLLASSKMVRGILIGGKLRSVPIRPEAKPDANGMVQIDIKAVVSNTLLSKISALGGTVIGSWSGFDTVRASVPVSQLETLASQTGVSFIRPTSKAVVYRNRAGLSGSPSQTAFPGSALPDAMPSGAAQFSAGAEREERVKAALPSLLSQFSLNPAARTTLAGYRSDLVGLGPVNTADPEGDYAHRAAPARSTFGVSGSGIKIGVISDSVDGLGQEQRAGRLPAVTVLPGQSGLGNTGEGTAMLEIVHRLAPSAQLYFATAFGSEAGFAQNIIALQAAGCNIIVDDVSYYDEPPFQDGIVAQAVNTVTAKGALYFSSAGNDYNADQASSNPFGATATWEGDWKDSGTAVFGESLLAYASANDNGNPVYTYAEYGSGYAGYAQQLAFLFWADPQGGATDDYDLFVFDPTGTNLLYYSADRQDGTQDPIEACEADQSDLIAVAKYSGNGVDLHLDITSDGAAALGAYTAGGTLGHSCAANAYCVAAVDASIDYKDGHPFQSSDVTEDFSSDGPRRIFFQPDGTPITPGNFLAGTDGGTVRMKPTLAAADGISDYFDPFYGTSAAAPHAAAIAALALSAKRTLTPAQMFTVLTGSCIDIDAPDYDRDSGVGVLDAYAAVQHALAVK